MQENIVKKASKELGITQKESEDKELNRWNNVKKDISNTPSIINVKERDIYYVTVGRNIGHEQNGKGEDFSRPVVVVKKLNKDLFLGVPTSSKIKNGSFFYYFEFEERTPNYRKVAKDIAVLAQAKVFSTKRVLNKIGVMKLEDFEQMKKKLKSLMFDPA